MRDVVTYARLGTLTPEVHVAKKIAKDLLPLARAARAAGWQVEVDGSHVVFYCESRRVTGVSNHGSRGPSTLKNIRSQLRQAGLEV